jgi:hypothetical protein
MHLTIGAKELPCDRLLLDEEYFAAAAPLQTGGGNGERGLAGSDDARGDGEPIFRPVVLTHLRHANVLLLFVGPFGAAA